MADTFYAVVVVRISDGVELCFVPGAKLPAGGSVPEAVITHIQQRYCKAQQFAVADRMQLEGKTYSFCVLNDNDLSFVLLISPDVNPGKGHEALKEISQLFYRMFVDAPANITPVDTLTFVKPAHDVLIRLGAAPLPGEGNAKDGTGRKEAAPGLHRVKQEIEEVKNLAMDNVSRAVQRGAKLDDIMEATDDLQFQAQGFHQNSRNVYNQMRWNSLKGKLVVGGVVSAFLLLILFTFFY